MSNPARPGWPDPSALPFMLFGSQAAAPVAQPLAQGMAGGMDLFKSFWGSLPGGTALPGFLVPTLDVEELDKRIGDLRAAESWVEVNLNMLRATIQGLEVQRNTIAAIQSLSAMAENPLGPKPAAAATTGGLPAGWPGPSSPPAAATPPVAEVEPQSTAASGEAKEAAGPSLAGLAANNWLGFLQDQFSKVAHATLAASPPTGSNPAAPVAKKAAARKAVTKVAARRRGPARKVAPR